MLGCLQIGIEDPAKSRDLLAYVEIDRCATDAIQTVTGCKLGNRTLKYFDYGKVAATFVNVATAQAVRVVAREDSRDAVSEYAPAGLNKKEAQCRAYAEMPEHKLFDVMPVHVDVPPHDLPGRPVTRVICDACGEGINDAREVQLPGRTVCRSCADGGYYRPVHSSREPSTSATATPVVTIVGNSNSGKTTVAVFLIEALTEKGYTVAAIKHCPHGHDVDRRGSDTHRMYSAGATTVIAGSPGRTTRVDRASLDPSLDLSGYPLPVEADIVIAEGFKTSLLPKVLVEGDDGKAPSIENVIAVVGSDRRTSAPDYYHRDELSELATLVENRFLVPPEGGAS